MTKPTKSGYERFEPAKASTLSRVLFVGESELPKNKINETPRHLGTRTACRWTSAYSRIPSIENYYYHTLGHTPVCSKLQLLLLILIVQCQKDINKATIYQNKILFEKQLNNLLNVLLIKKWRNNNSKFWTKSFTLLQYTHSINIKWKSN